MIMDIPKTHEESSEKSSEIKNPRTKPDFKDTLKKQKLSLYTS